MSAHDWDFDRLTRDFAERLVYLVGNARGGSTFGNAAVAIHPNLLEVRWNDRTFVELWPSRHTASDEEWRKLLLRTPGYYDEPKVRQILGAGGVERLHRHVERLCRVRNLSEVLCFAGILFWLTHGAKPGLDQMHGWCIKANTWQGIDLVMQTFPRAKLLIVQRDPRSTALSMAKVMVRGTGRSFADIELSRGALDWLRNAAEFTDRLSRYKDRALAFRYEDLVKEPVATLERVHTFLGLPTVNAEAILHALSNMTYSCTQATRKEETERGVRRGGLERWRKELSSEQSTLVAALTAEGAKRFSYELDANLGDLIRILPTLNSKAVLKYIYCRYKLARCGAINMVEI